MQDATPERWLPVPGYSNYRVSDQGRVWSRPRPGTVGGMLKPSPASAGYLAVSLSRGTPAKSTTWAMHVLVALAFLGDRPAGYEVCHNDGDPLNNRLSNLRYDTISGNRQDSVRHGTHRNTRKTHCPNNHEYTEENTYTRPGSNERQCRICLTQGRSTGECSECGDPVCARGMCRKHYGRWYRQQRAA
jgi:hypothetical protein